MQYPAGPFWEVKGEPGSQKEMNQTVDIIERLEPSNLTNMPFVLLIVVVILLLSFLQSNFKNAKKCNFFSPRA